MEEEEEKEENKRRRTGFSLISEFCKGNKDMPSVICVLELFSNS
jgi:hypothetical protein